MQDYVKEFNNRLQSIDISKSTIEKFSDYLSLTAYSIAQPFYKSEELEEKYLNTAKKYNKKDLDKFCKLFAITVEALENKMHDFLGLVFSSNDMGSSYKGQFFTPYHVSKMMSEITGYNLKEELKHKNYITLSEPCSGSGGMVIAFAQTIMKYGFNYQKKLYVEAIDIDENCFKMTYIQLSLLGIPAKVILGDTLAQKFKAELYTPMFFINNWYVKLQELNNEHEAETEKIEEIIETSQVIEIKERRLEDVIDTVQLGERIQLKLF